MNGLINFKTPSSQLVSWTSIKMMQGWSGCQLRTQSSIIWLKMGRSQYTSFEDLGDNETRDWRTMNEEKVVRDGKINEENEIICNQLAIPVLFSFTISSEMKKIMKLQKKTR